jgi:glucosylceramidase
MFDGLASPDFFNLARFNIDLRTHWRQRSISIYGGWYLRRLEKWLQWNAPPAVDAFKEIGQSVNASSASHSMKPKHFVRGAAFLSMCLLLFSGAFGGADTTTQPSAKVYFSSEYHPKSPKWFTAPWDESQITYRLSRQHDVPITRLGETTIPEIAIDPSEIFQTVTGIGTSLDESSCYAIQKNHNDEQINEILRALIDPDEGIGMSLFRICFGTSDFSDGRSVSSTPRGWYSYQDDPNTPLSVKNDATLGIVRVLKLALKVAAACHQPIRIFASAWSPPAWMKSSHSMVGGKLLPNMVDAYASYLTSSIQAYQAEGIPIYAITTNNEHYFAPDRYPGCYFDAQTEARLVEALGIGFQHAGLKTRVWILDHNYNLWRQAKRTLDILRTGTPGGNGYGLVDAVAFHHYGGTPSQMSRLHDAYPDMHIEFSEGSVWGTAGVAEICDMFNNWSQSYMNWVTMVTQTTQDHIQGPYSTPGALSPTLLVKRNGPGPEWYKTPEYFLVGQVSKFVRPGAARIGVRSGVGSVSCVAFKNPDGLIVIILVNQNEWKVEARLVCGTNQIAIAVPAGTVADAVFNLPAAPSQIPAVAPPAVPGPQQPSAGDAQVTKKWWLNVTGGINGLSADPRFPDHPSGSRLLDTLKTSDNADKIKSNCVTSITGYLIPNSTGSFTFSIAADGYGEFWLSIDDDPSRKRLICKCPSWVGNADFEHNPAQSSDRIKLQSGMKYYFQALQQGGGGNGHLEVGWSPPGLGSQKVVSGTFLSDK